MQNSFKTNQVLNVNNFKALLATEFKDEKNAIAWKRTLKGDFSEIISKIKVTENITSISKEQLRKLKLSAQGQIARETLINDLDTLTSFGALPTLNIIKNYEKDTAFPFFPTDVYSFHVDKSPIATDTFLCTYSGEPSEIIANSEATQKILIPEVVDGLKKLHDNTEEAFEDFLSAFFFDLHYQPKPNATITNLGIGNLWKLAIKHPESNVLPCIHRAPIEKEGESRLLLIC